MNPPVVALRSLLAEFSLDRNPNMADYTTRFREAFIAFGSETEDNLNAVSRIDVGELLDTRPAFLSGLRISSSGHSVSGILNTLEGEPIPESIRTAMPELDQEDFDSALRVAVLCLSVFDNSKPK